MVESAVDIHFRQFSGEQRRTLEAVRRTILESLSGANEVIKYGIPTFVIEGVAVIGLDGYKNHNSLFPYGSAINLIFEKELSSFVKTKGSIHFSKERPFPKTLLKKIIRERIRLINATYPKKNGEYLQFYLSGELKVREKR
jgi:uncharacterized protein YdhG (YjbR/CyaY superfamily)